MTLNTTPCVDAGHPAVMRFARERGVGSSARARAVALFYAVRDTIRYDPYTFDISPASLRASHVLHTRRSWCVPKAVLLAACCRALGIPARLGFADVRNHLSTARMRAAMGTDVFAWHGYTLIALDGRWLKATPAFNIELCEKFRLAPLDFDGRQDALYHPFDLEGSKHMEYLRDRGEYEDVPVDAMRATLREMYPSFRTGDHDGADFEAEADAENRRRDRP